MVATLRELAVGIEGLGARLHLGRLSGLDGLHLLGREHRPLSPRSLERRQGRVRPVPLEVGMAEGRSGHLVGCSARVVLLREGGGRHRQ